MTENFWGTHPERVTNFSSWQRFQASPMDQSSGLTLPPLDAQPNVLFFMENLVHPFPEHHRNGKCCCSFHLYFLLKKLQTNRNRTPSDYVNSSQWKSRFDWDWKSTRPDDLRLLVGSNQAWELSECHSGVCYCFIYARVAGSYWKTVRRCLRGCRCDCEWNASRWVTVIWV